MKKLKQLLTWTPELYFLFLCSWWTLDSFLATPTFIQYTAIILIITLTTLMLTQNKILGYCIAGILGSLSLYLILALISDLQKIESFDGKSKNFAIIGTLLILGNLTMASLMFLKYLRLDKNQNPVTTGH